MCSNIPLVSIVIPVYNGANYMREAIDSALAQTYQNIEVVVVNDGSTDETEDVAMSYGNEIKYISQENGGQSAALNRGIEAMSGEYFSWLSHDDVYYIDKIGKQVDVLRACIDHENLIAFADIEYIDAAGRVLSQTKYSSISDKNQVYQILNGNMINACTLLIPKRMLYENGLFNTKRPHTSDVEMILRLALAYRFVRVGEVLVKSRVHSGQVSKRNLRYHIHESNLFGTKALEMINKDLLYQSASFSGVIKPYCNIAVRWHSRGFWAAGQSALKYAILYETKDGAGAVLFLRCIILYTYRKIRRGLSRIMRKS